MSVYMDIKVSELQKNGCKEDVIFKINQLTSENDKPEIMLILRKYRHELKNELDADGKLIDCVDYLIYNLEKAK